MEGKEEETGREVVKPRLWTGRTMRWTYKRWRVQNDESGKKKNVKGIE
jgi:hypothetical protein